MSQLKIFHHVSIALDKNRFVRVNHQAQELWMKGFLIPRPNLLHLFLEQGETNVEITLGLKREISPMVSKVDPGSGHIMFNDFTGCPINCSPDGML